MPACPHAQAGQQGQQQVPAPERSQDEERRQRSLSLQPSTTAAAAAPSEPPPPPAHRVNAFFAALEAPHVESGETLLARARFLRGQARALEAHALLTAACLESGLSLGDLAAHSEALGEAGGRAGGGGHSRVSHPRTAASLHRPAALAVYGLNKRKSPCN